MKNAIENAPVRTDLRFTFFVALSLFALSSAVKNAHASECPNLSSDASESEKIPKVSALVGKKGSLVVCGNLHRDPDDESAFESGKNPEAPKHLNEFTVSFIPTKGKAKKVYEVGALEHYLVERVGTKLKLTELAYFNERWIPVFEKEVVCEKNCKVTAEKCALKKPNAPRTNAIAAYREFEEGKMKGKAPDELIVQGILDQALAGNAEAIALFFPKGSNGKLVASKVKHSGAGAESYFAGRKLLTRLQEKKCL